MFKEIKEILNKFLLKIHILPLITAVRVLKILEVDYGHFKSVYRWQAIDSNNSPIPWLTYPAINYLKSLKLRGMTVFEFGCGNSTLFLAKHAKSVTSVENNKKWYRLIHSEIASYENGRVLFHQNEVNYVKSIGKQGHNFDMIVIDGIARKRCAAEALKHLKRKGLIIVDNSDIYPNVCKFLINKGFTEIPMKGFGPINPYTWTTSFFTKC